jgi:cytochrome b6-f complex iron-sulfur subunit
MGFFTRPKKPADSRPAVKSTKLGKNTPKIQVDSDAYSIKGGTISVNLEKVPELSRAGGSAAIVNDPEQVYLIIARTAENEYVAASSQCTHHEKPLIYDNKEKTFTCISRKSVFRLDGSIVKGPTEIPLRVYKSHFQQGNLTIDLSS